MPSKPVNTFELKKYSCGCAVKTRHWFSGTPAVTVHRAPCAEHAHYPERAPFTNSKLTDRKAMSGMRLCWVCSQSVISGDLEAHMRDHKMKANPILDRPTDSDRHHREHNWTPVCGYAPRCEPIQQNNSSIESEGKRWEWPEPHIVDDPHE